MRELCAGGDIADLIWEAPDDLAAGHELAFFAAMRAYHAGDAQEATQHWDDLQQNWSRCWAANAAALEFMQHAGLARFAPDKPQRWVVASFGHHTGPHGIQHPHVHNIVITALKTRARRTCGSRPPRPAALGRARPACEPATSPACLVTPQACLLSLRDIADHRW
jgi:hypothetical protein